MLTTQRIIEIINKYKKMLSFEYSPVRCARSSFIYCTDTDHTKSHALWMCAEIPRLLDENKIEKVMRWLGFVQGILWCNGLVSIDELCSDNKNDVSLTEFTTATIEEQKNQSYWNE